MAIFKVIKYDGAIKVLARKFPGNEFNTQSQLIVNESQEAVFFKGGKVMDIFGPGTYTLNTRNIPILSAFINLPFGGRSPFSAEVWFVNKVFVLDLKWGTTAPIQIQDPKYNVLLPVRTFGNFGVQITDSKKFITSLVGVSPYLDADTLSNYFSGILVNHISDCISSYLINRKISILEITAYLTELSDEIAERILPTFAKYGVVPVNFTVMSVNLPEKDKSVISLKEALAKRAQMDIIGYSYVQERSFDTLETAAQNEGTAGTLMGAGIGLGVGNEMGSILSETMKDISPINISNKPEKNEDMQLICPNCGNPNKENSKFCSSCGDKLETQLRFCTECGIQIQVGENFCSSCGQPVQNESDDYKL